MPEQLLITLGVGVVLALLYLSHALGRSDRSGLELPVLVLIFLILAAAATLIWADREDFPASLMSGLLIAGSALFGLVFNAGVARQDAQRLRRERREDVQRALVAEIKHYVQALNQFPLDQAWEDMAPRIRNGHIPFVPSENNDTVFNAVLADIHVLPRHVIDPVVKYYSQINEIEAAIQDIRSDVFRTGGDVQDNRRRELMYREYLEVKLRALDYGKRALAALDATTEPDVSSPAAVR